MHFNPSQNASPVLLFNGLVMVKNEGSISCKSATGGVLWKKVFLEILQKACNFIKKRL